MNAKEFLAYFTQSMGALMMFAFELESESGKAQFLAHIAEMKQMTLSQGYVRLAEDIDALRIVADNQDVMKQQALLRTLELVIYEQLAAIQEVDGSETGALALQQPASILFLWASENLLDNLLTLSELMKQVKYAHEAVDVPKLVTQLASLLKYIYYGCKHYSLDTAAQLAMALYDLFDRSLGANGQLDMLIVNMTQQFAAELNVIICEIEEGEQPDLATMQDLLTQAPDVTFIAQGKKTAGQIGMLVGLPEGFLRVLTPESVEAIGRVKSEGLTLYIIHAQMNENESADIAFLTWISQGHTRVINSVTDQSGVALFDLLISSKLGTEEIIQGLVTIGAEYQLTDWRASISTK